jgi:Concanavalin A-like lectin/glucanases superfamily/WD40-like Beta Propeller Repeat
MRRVKVSSRFHQGPVALASSIALLVSVGAIDIAVRDSASADVITVTVPGCVVDPGDVLGWWPGQNDLTGAIGPDLTGTVAFADSLIGRGVLFDGTSDASTVELPAVTDGLTVEAWIKPVFSTNVQTIASRWDFPSVDDSARSYSLELIGNDLMWMTDETSSRRPEELRVPAPFLFDNEFHHVAATWNQTQMVVYVDGAAWGTAPSQGGVLNPAITTPFRLGGEGGIGASFRFEGIIDESAVIKRALTAAEVDEMVGAGPNAKCVFAASTGMVGPGLQVQADGGGVDPIVSADGRYVLFRTRSTDVFPIVNDAPSQTPGVDLDMFDNYRDDLVLLDTQGSTVTTDDTLELVSVNSDELGGALDSFMANMTPTASHVVFSSISNDLVAGDTLAGRDVFIRNRLDGTTSRVSVRSDGSQPQYTATGLNNDSRMPTVNDNGTVVAFESTNRDLAPETNPVPGDTWQTYDIYVRDMSDPNPANHFTERITVGAGDVKANGSSSTPIVSPDGRYVWFTSSASNLVAGDTNARQDMFVHDRQTHVTTRLGIATANGQAPNGDSYLADVSPDGRWVTFSSNATNLLLGDTNGQFDAFRLDTQTSLVTVASTSGARCTGIGCPAFFPQSNAASFAGSVSDDGRFVFFQSSASNLVPGDANTRNDVFIADLMNDTTQRVSFNADGSERNGASSNAVATADGKSVVYLFQGVGEGFFSIWRSKLVLP